MRDCKEFIASGILELYVIGLTSPDENALVVDMAGRYAEVEEELLSIEIALQHYATSIAIPADPTGGTFIIAVLDYQDRLQKGEPFAVAPELFPGSAVADYQEWVGRKDMVAPADFMGIFAKIITAIPGRIVSAIVWIKDMAPQEVHDDEYERFLILEGTCDIIVEEDVYSLKEGDYFQIPLHKRHVVMITSDIPCKVILQRVKVAA